ncbi:MAG TPA: BatA domain-containing protein [Sedimentisphaerales bacterium]|nr:BatA domain-containing protein [Sedimentisphaerales bacterium]
MSFLAWTFLFGSAAVIGPIAAHLLAKPRFRRVPFTMLQFLRAGRQESHSRRKLRDILVLLLRCAIIVLIAVLFARPVLEVQSPPQSHKPVLYLALDDSASMAYRDRGESLFSKMIEKAIDHVRQAPSDAVFGVCGLASGRTAEGLTRSQALAEIGRLAVVSRSARPADFVKALESQGSAGFRAGVLSAVVLSDFSPDVLRQFERIRKPAAVDALSHEIVAPRDPVSNVAIADANPIETADNKLDIDVVVANGGDKQEHRKLIAKFDDLRPVSTDVTLSAGERKAVRIRIDLGPRGQGTGRSCLPLGLSLEPRDGLEADDVYRLGVCMVQTAATKVLVISRGDEAFLFETAVEALMEKGTAGGMNLRKTRESDLRSDDLEWADVVVFSSLPTNASYPISLLRGCLARGGRLVFFATDLGSPQIADMLLREGLIPAVPQRWSQGLAWPQPQPVAGEEALSSEATIQTLASYRFDKIALKGHWLCRTSSQAQCVWRLANDAAFIYTQAQNTGISILVNTSIDDSRGLLAKSGAWVAFCRFLVGEGERVRRLCLRAEDRPTLELPASMRAVGRTLVHVENCDGGKARAAIEGARLVLPAPQGIGWMRTQGEPMLHVGVNLPQGETNLLRPTEDAVAAAMKRAFLVEPGRERSLAQGIPPVQSKLLWRAFAWAIVPLLLLEPVVTNRLKR